MHDTYKSRMFSLKSKRLKSKSFLEISTPNEFETLNVRQNRSLTNMEDMNLNKLIHKMNEHDVLLKQCLSSLKELKNYVSAT
jgi:hypothetical protein